ncbi:hypothetical protein GCM10010495_18020 [Kitasatospora herbaricolor]|uniref:hypothetical protein n=1 Tax=Kitasatospora herbaricolor TaxID=68217 RepID=UPI00174E1905|nr:hypothetical protein [Kitasatospora herbaricolor]MDQ0308250.1 hypothetical protein [Kitasatospora herbaricolor]GGV06287.1 hypothetical protein GCM10010495_18020 [Kitasatospora herbaricolor]
MAERDDGQAAVEQSARPATHRVVLKEDQREAGPLGRPRTTEVSDEWADQWDERIWRRA